MKEHLIETMGGNYRVCDPEMLLGGMEKIIQDCLWHKSTRNKIIEFIKIYGNVAPVIKRYIEVHDIFLAPIRIDKRKRRLIEGNIAIAVKY